MLEVSDVVYQGGGMIIAFNDNSTVVAVPKVVDGQLTLEGLTDEQETALEIFNDAANVDRLVADPRTNLIFGDDFQSVEDESESSITGTSGFQTKIQMITPELTGIYLLLWHAQGRCEGPNATGEGRVELQCSDVTEATFPVHFGMHQALNITPASGGPLKEVLSGHKVVVLTGSPKTYRISWRTKDNDDTAYICRARLALWRLR
jgi:hypothetical protein